MNYNIPTNPPDPRLPKELIPMIRRTFPKLIRSEIVGIQPMCGPIGLFALRYGDNGINFINNYFQNVTWPKNIDMVVTSPPYKDEDGYTDNLIREFAQLSFKNMKDNSLLFMNFGHLAGFKSRPFDAAKIVEEAGFTWIDTITWIKNHYRPIQGQRRVNNLTEFVFMFGKGTPTIDRLAIGIPYADKSNVSRWKGTGGKDLKCAGNVWDIPYDTVTDKKDKLHNDRFPLGLPEKCIRLAGLEKASLIVDPFAGSGTTAVAAYNEGMRFWGTEKDGKHYKTSRLRMENLITNSRISKKKVV